LAQFFLILSGLLSGQPSLAHLPSKMDQTTPETSVASLWEPAFPAEEYEGRQQRIISRMREQGLDVLISTDPANFNYATGYDGGSFYVPQYLLVFAGVQSDSAYVKEGCALILRGMDLDGAFRTTHMSSDDLVGYKDDYVHNKFGQHAVKEAVKFIMERTAATPHQLRIGIGEMDKMDVEAYLALLKEVDEWSGARAFEVKPCIEDSDLLINWVKLVKTDAEIEFLRHAARIADNVMATGVKAMKAGRRQCEVAGEISKAQVWGADGTRGGDAPSLWPFIATGVDASCAHLPWTDSPLPEGTATFLELSGAYKRYNCPIARTVFLKPKGTASESQDQLFKDFDRMHKVVYEALSVACAKCVPGNKAEDAMIAFNEVLKKHGQAKKMSRMGYSIGVGYPPDWGERTVSIREGDTTVFQKNMVFHFIAGMWLSDRGYELSEAIVVKDENGPEFLCRTPRELFVIEPEESQTSPVNELHDKLAGTLHKRTSSGSSTDSSTVATEASATDGYPRSPTSGSEDVLASLSKVIDFHEVVAVN